MSSSPPKIVVVVPTIRPESHASFVKAWTPLFEKHAVTLVTVWDGEAPRVTMVGPYDYYLEGDLQVWDRPKVVENRDLFCRRTDACRNLGFVVAASMNPTHVLTMDDDVVPLKWDNNPHQLPGISDCIQSHLDALERRVPLGWMNTAHDTDLYLRGVPYGIRNEAPVMLSHGVWVGTPDFDGETQLRLESGADCPKCRGKGRFEDGHACHVCHFCRGTGKFGGIPHSLPYYVGPIPRGVLFPLCGMNVMVKVEALPYLYFAPMGVDAGVMGHEYVAKKPVSAGQWVTTKDVGTRQVPILHRFADIFMGIFLKRKFDELGWGCVTGYSTVHHTRASDARKNFEQEKLGREWMERIDEWDDPVTEFIPDATMHGYFDDYADKRTRYEALVKSLLEKK